MCSLYHASASLIVNFHHSSEDADISATSGPTIKSQSPSCNGPVVGFQDGNTGRSGIPVLTISIPFTMPASSFPSVIFRCISFLESIINAMNSSDFSVNSPWPVELPFGGLPASFGGSSGGLQPPDVFGIEELPTFGGSAASLGQSSNFC